MLACVLVLAALLLTSCGGDDPAQGAMPDGRLFVKLVRHGPEQVVMLDPSSGRQAVVPYSRAIGGDPPFQLSVSGDTLVFYGQRRSSQGVYGVGVRGRETPRLLGRPSYFVPSATDGRIWFVRPASITEVAVASGRVLLRGGRQPCRGPVVAATSDALLCQARTELLAFDPAHGRVLARLPGAFPVATLGHRVASCTQDCGRVHVTDVHTGGAAAIRPGDAFELEATYEGAFSPDGSLLAMPAVARLDRVVEPRRVALVDVRERRATLVPHGRLGGYGQLAWSPSGDWLVFTAGRRRLMAWPRGGDRPVRLPLDVRGTIADMATAR